jgi:hypothetical protein
MREGELAELKQRIKALELAAVLQSDRDRIEVNESSRLVRLPQTNTPPRGLTDASEGA